ncbi:DNA polymerase Y family protein [Streptacidiphilus sp. PAMC 29251]
MNIIYAQPVEGGQAAWESLIRVLGGITPVVEALPPDAALANVSGSTRYFRMSPVDIGRMVRMRCLATYGVDCTIGLASNPMLARMVARDGDPGAVRILMDRPGDVSEFLRAKPIGSLDGVGAKTSRVLKGYGLDTVGKVAGVPEGTLQRILGRKQGSLFHQRSRGLDTTPVIPRSAARPIGFEYHFDRARIDESARRRALLGLAVEIGDKLRNDARTARVLTLSVRYADRSATTRSRTLSEPTAHTPLLVGHAYALHDALGLQRARVSSLSLRAEELAAAELSGYQLTFDRQAHNARRLEPVIDRITARWPGMLKPGSMSMRTEWTPREETVAGEHLRK